jgi:hypothetical protein
MTLAPSVRGPRSKWAGGLHNPGGVRQRISSGISPAEDANGPSAIAKHLTPTPYDEAKVLTFQWRTVFSSRCGGSAMAARRRRIALRANRSAFGRLAYQLRVQDQAVVGGRQRRRRGAGVYGSPRFIAWSGRS